MLAWPWEALYDPEGTTLVHTCRIERQLDELNDPLPLPNNLPTDSIHILLVIARPYADEDVDCHALARPLVELSLEQALPIRVDVLRPPTLDQLRKTLAEKPGFYHIVHFDGHSGYGSSDSDHSSSKHSYQDSQSKLIFETQDGKQDAIEAERLTQLLSEYRIPITVLNACQSARIDENADDPFASVAAALLKAGMRSVVAMGYNLYVSAAQQFVPAFYHHLFQHGSVAEATRAGRQAMLAHPQRTCSRIAGHDAGDIAALTQSLAAFAMNNLNFQHAGRLCKNLADHYHQHNDDEGLAITYHQLDSIDQEQWYLKSLDISEHQGKEHLVASTYHQLGRIAQAQQDFACTERWYLKSLAISEKQRNEHGAANTYAFLGLLYQLQQRWIGAAQWFIKAAVGFIKTNDKHSIANVTKDYIGLLQQSDEQYHDE